MATEIRLELDVTGSDLARYQQLTPISRDALPLLVADRRQTWNVIFCSDLSISTQTGRLASMSGIQLNGAAGFSVTPNEVDPSDPEYNCIANDAFNRHVSKSLVLFARMREVTASRSEYRNVFNSRWKASVAQWNLDWPHIRELQLVSMHRVRFTDRTFPRRCIRSHPPLPHQNHVARPLASTSRSVKTDLARMPRSCE